MWIFKKIAEIFRKIVIGYVFYSFPLMLIGIVIIPKPHLQSNAEVMKYVQDVILSSTIYSIALAQIFIWVLTSWFLSISLFFSRNTREIVLNRLSGIKERDEREAQIVGKALRASYLSTLTILLFLLFMSLIKLEVGIKLEPGQPSYMTSVFWGFGDKIYDSEAITTKKEGYVKFFKYRDLPLSTSTLILILLVWQIISFRVVSRRALKVPD